MAFLAQLGRTLIWVMAAAVLAVPFLSAGGPLSLIRVAVHEPTALTITGSIDGLRSGQPAELHLTLHNDGSEAAVMHHVTAAVEGAGGCAATDLAIAPWTGTLSVPAHGAALTTLHALLRAGAACPGATWRLRYTSG